MSISLSLLVSIWALGLICIALHRIGIRYSPMLLRVALGGMIVLHAWRPIVLLILHSFPSLIDPNALLPFPLASPILGPVVFVTLLMVAAYEGSLQANLLTFNLGVVSVLSGIVSIIVTHWFGTVVVDLAPNLEAALVQYGLRQFIANTLALVVGLYTTAILFQFITKRWRRKSVWFACMAAMLGGWVNALLFSVGGYAATPAFSWVLRTEFAGWTLAILFLYPLATLYIGHLCGRPNRWKWGLSHGSKTSMGVVRKTFDLRAALEESKRRLFHMSEAFRLLQEARDVVLRAKDPDGLIQEACNLLVEFGGYPLVWIGMVDEEHETVHPAASCGNDVDYLVSMTTTAVGASTALGPIKTAILENRTYVIQDIDKESRFTQWCAKALARGFRSAATFPMRVEDRVLGTLNIYSFEQGVFDEEIVEVMQAVADDVTQSVARLQLEQRRGEEFEALRRVSLSLISSRELKTVLDTILTQTLDFVKADDAHIFLYDGEHIVFGAARWAGEDRGAPYSEPRPSGLTYTVARSGKSIVIGNTLHHELFADDPWEGAITGIPLKIANRVVGVMNVAFLQPHDFEFVELRVLEILADQAAIAIENVRLYEASESERRRVNLLHNIAQDLTQTLEPAEILQRAVNLISENVDGESSEAFVLDPDGDRLRVLASVRRDRIPLAELDERIDMRVGKGLVGWVAEHSEAVLVADVREDDRWLPIPGVNDSVRSASCVPVYTNEKLHAIIAVLHKEVDAFRSEHLDLMVAIGHQIGLALENAERYQQINRRLAETTALRYVAQVVNSRLEMQPLLSEVVRQVGEELGYPVVEIYLIEGDELVLKAARGSPEDGTVRLALSEGVIGRAVRMGEPIYVPDVSQDPDYVSLGFESNCEIVVPLRKDDVVVGVLNVESPIPNDLNEDDMRLLTLLADNISIAIENAALYERLRQHAQNLEKTVDERTAELAEALKQAQEADMLKTRFVSDVSHELRTPLSNILLYLELIGKGKSERFDSYLETLNRETDRLVVLIEDLLTVSRLDAGTAKLDPRPVSLNEIARSLVEDRERLFAEKDLEVGFDLLLELPPIIADDRMLSQVVANLMTNAMNYTPPGGQVTISSRIEIENGNRWAILSVADTGLGISEEEQGQIFQRFFRGKASREVGTPGTGLGLAICVEIMRRHSGRISVESEIGKGSVFTIWLPLEPLPTISDGTTDLVAGQSTRQTS